MSAFPDNVVVLADRRRDRFAYPYETIDPDPVPHRPHLRLVSTNERPEPFTLEVFLRRAAIVMTEMDDTQIVPFHAPASA
jgi:hypothetical protein